MMLFNPLFVDYVLNCRDKKNRGYSSGKRIFRINAATKRKPGRRHNTDVSLFG